MSAPQTSTEEQQAALGALLSVLDINPVNLLKLKDDVPEGFVCRHFIQTAFRGLSAKDLSGQEWRRLAAETRHEVEAGD